MQQIKEFIDLVWDNGWHIVVICAVAAWLLDMFISTIRGD